jgi:hypothetical protein
MPTREQSNRAASSYRRRPHSREARRPHQPPQAIRTPSNLNPINRVAKKMIIAGAAGGRGDPCTQCEAQSCARRATLLSGAVTRWRAYRCAVRLSSIRVRSAHDQLTPSLEGRGTGCGKGTLTTKSNRDEVPHLPLIPGAGVTPAQGSVKPTVGFTFNKVIYPSPP